MNKFIRVYVTLFVLMCVTAAAGLLAQSPAVIVGVGILGLAMAAVRIIELARRSAAQRS